MIYPSLIQVSPDSRGIPSNRCDQVICQCHTHRFDLIIMWLYISSRLLWRSLPNHLMLTVIMSCSQRLKALRSFFSFKPEHDKAKMGIYISNCSSTNKTQKSPYASLVPKSGLLLIPKGHIPHHRHQYDYRGTESLCFHDHQRILWRLMMDIIISGSYQSKGLFDNLKNCLINCFRLILIKWVW